MTDNLGVNARMLTKYRVFRERAAIGGRGTVCELCERKQATDLHEVINRVHYPPELLNDVPDALLSCLCNQCNVTLADQTWARKLLFEKNVKRYGIDVAHAQVSKFAAKLRTFSPNLKLWNLLGVGSAELDSAQ